MKKKILIVEDEILVAEDIRQTILELGYNVSSVVSSGEQAVEEANIHKPDLVLMDIFLSGEMDGIEAANQIHSRLNIPVIFLTAYDDKQIMEQTRISKPYAFINKPFNKRELHANIEFALQRH